jgi:hypothetical protein
MIPLLNRTIGKVFVGTVLLFVGALLTIAQTGTAPQAPATTASKPSASLSAAGKPFQIVAAIPTTPALTTRSGTATNPGSLSWVSTETSLRPWIEAVQGNTTGWSASNSLCLIEGSTPSISLTAKDKDGISVNSVRWTVIRNPQEVAQTQDPFPKGDETPSRKLSLEPPAEPTATVTLRINAVGSFAVVAYLPPAGRTSFVEGDPAIYAHIIVCRVSVPTNGDLSQKYNSGYYSMATSTVHINDNSLMKDNICVYFGDFGPNQNEPTFNNVGIKFRAKVDVIGGGNMGRWGVKRVFAGWSNNVITYSCPASYPSTPTTHSTQNFLCNGDITDWGLPHYITTGLPNQSYSSLDPSLSLDHPLLDTGRDLPAENPPGTGGASICLKYPSNPQEGEPIDLDLGKQRVVIAYDAPRVPAVRYHPNFPTETMSNFRVDLRFKCRLVVWTDVANRLYSCIDTRGWTCAGTFHTFTWGEYPSCTPNGFGITLDNAVSTCPAVPVVDGSIKGETYPPVIIKRYNLYDASN